MTQKQKPHRRNKTVHWLTLQEPVVIAAVRKLRADWESLDAIGRSDRLRGLINTGCSTHGLARPLGICSTTVRRYVELSELSDAVRERIRQGGSVKKILKGRAAERKAARRQALIAEEKQFGRHSDRVASFMVDFCREAGQVRSCEVPQLTLSIRLILSDGGYRRLRKFSKRTPMKKLLRITRPEDRLDEVSLEQRARWLADLIANICSEPLIWGNALDKLEARAKEIDPEPPTRTPVQTWQESAKRHLTFEEEFKKERERRRWY